MTADGPAPEGVQTRTAGLLSYPEICIMILNDNNKDLRGEHGPLRKVTDPTKRYGSYAYRLADDNGNHGIWIGFEDPDSAGNKASFVRGKGFGGISVFDLSFEDVRGACSDAKVKFPIVAKIKEKLA